MTANRYDVVVIGGGAAGLAAAVTLGRARRSTLVIDTGRPRNIAAHAVHGFLGHDGIAPLELLALGRAEAARYHVEVREATATKATRLPEGFAITLDDSSVVTASRVLLATGLVDTLPSIDGVEERWGRDAIHCPYCHGWEVRDEVIGVIGGLAGVNQALLFRQWSSKITLFLHDGPIPGVDEREKLDARGIRVVLGVVSSLKISEDALSGVLMADGSEYPVTAVVIPPSVSPRQDISAGLGLELMAHPSGLGSFIATEAFGVTSEPGVFVAGNIADLSAQVIGAAADGTRVGAMVNADLVMAETAAAVIEYRRRHGRAGGDEA